MNKINFFIILLIFYLLKKDICSNKKYKENMVSDRSFFGTYDPTVLRNSPINTEGEYLIKGVQSNDEWKYGSIKPSQNITFGHITSKIPNTPQSKPRINNIEFKDSLDIDDYLLGKKTQFHKHTHEHIHKHIIEFK